VPWLPHISNTGAIGYQVFEAYLERVLLPEHDSGRIVVINNLSAHKTERVRELVEGAGCELLYLPPYSPDLNSIYVRGGQVVAVVQYFREGGGWLGGEYGVCQRF
jgi:ribosomal protein L19